MTFKKKVCCLLILSLFGFLGGCRTPNYKPVKDHDIVYLLPGYSLKAPKGKGWFLARKNDTKIVFFRKTETPSKSLVAMAILHELPEVKTDTEEEFLKMVSKIRSRKDDSYRKILQQEKISHEKSTFTVRFYTKYRDYIAKNRPRGMKYLVTEDLGILWRHPEYKNIGLTVCISQQYPENEPIPDFNAIAEDFISNVNIEPL